MTPPTPAPDRPEPLTDDIEFVRETFYEMTRSVGQFVEGPGRTFGDLYARYTARFAAHFAAPTGASREGLDALSVNDTMRLLRGAVETGLLAKARHRWQHPTFPFGGTRCDCDGWAAKIVDMLDLSWPDPVAASSPATGSEEEK